jgi:hypothetical protein
LGLRGPSIETLVKSEFLLVAGYKLKAARKEEKEI